MEKSYSEDFKYSHKNPYHDKLELFDDFVLRDHDAEQHKGNWNKSIFQRQAPLTLEIGAGYGHFMMEYCQNIQDENYIGLDYRFKRSFDLAKKLASHPSKSFRYLRAKGERLEFLFGKEELDKIFYFFPDPWPKTRQHKKRLFKDTFLHSAHAVLKNDGQIFIKTDHDEYADQMHKIISRSELFELEFYADDLYRKAPEHFLAKYNTKFEKIFLAQDIKIKAFVIKKKINA